MTPSSKKKKTHKQPTGPRVIHSVKREKVTLRPLKCDVSLFTNSRSSDLLLKAGLQIFSTERRVLVRLSPRKFAPTSDPVPSLLERVNPHLADCNLLVGVVPVRLHGFMNPSTDFCAQVLLPDVGQSVTTLEYVPQVNFSKLHSIRHDALNPSPSCPTLEHRSSTLLPHRTPRQFVSPSSPERFGPPWRTPHWWDEFQCRGFAE